MSLLDFVAGAQRRVLNVSGGCHSCVLKRVNYVPATLTAGKVLFLCDSPGESDVVEQIACIGASGQLLRRFAEEEKVSGPLSFSYVAHCRPAEGGVPPKAVTCCLSEMVLDEVRAYQTVVLCGNAPLQAFFPGAKADHFRGNFARHPDFPEQRFYAVYDPAYIIRRPDLEGDLRRQLNRLARVVSGAPEANPQFEVIRGAGALEALREMCRSPLFSLDKETTSLYSWAVGERITSVCASADGKRVVAIHEKEPHFEAALDLLVAYVTDPAKAVCGNNVGFDLEWLERVRNIRAVCQVHELSVMWYQIGQYKMPSLKELVAKELDGYRHLVHEPHTITDPDMLLQYNAEDVIYSLRLFWKAMKRMKSSTRDLCMRVLGPVSLVLRRMTAQGLYIREDYRQQKLVEYEERRREIVQKWHDEDPEFTPSVHESGNGAIKYLYEIRNFPVLEQTESGDPSTDASVLKQLVRDGYAQAQHLLDLREVDKVLTTYLRAYDKTIWSDSRVRPSFPITWTDTGRSSSRDPNTQNIPRAKEIRNLFGVPPGAALIESDLSQIEFRIMVCLAQDENGIAGYLRGEDAHTLTARGITGRDQVTKEERSLAKPVNFGFLYGAQAKTFRKVAANDYGVLFSLADAQTFRNTFMRTYPRIPDFHAASREKLIKNRGWFQSVLGHNFYYKDWDHPNEGKRDHEFRSALNSEAQGPAAQIMFYIMVLARQLLDERGFMSVGFVNTVHDSVLTEVPNAAWVPDVVATIEEASKIAEQWVKRWFVVPLILEHQTGEAWGSLQEIKRAA